MMIQLFQHTCIAGQSHSQMLSSIPFVNILFIQGMVRQEIDPFESANLSLYHEFLSPELVPRLLAGGLCLLLCLFLLGLLLELLDLAAALVDHGLLVDLDGALHLDALLPPLHLAVLVGADAADQEAAYGPVCRLDG